MTTAQEASLYTLKVSGAANLAHSGFLTSEIMGMNFSTALLSYCAIAYTWSWSFWLLSTLARQRSGFIPPLLGAIGTFGPLIAAAIVTSWRSRLTGVRSLFLCGLQWQLGWRWYLVMLGLPALVLWLALAVHQAMGATVPDYLVVNHWLLVPVSFILVLVLGGPLGEEFGWRGFLVPLFQSRFNPLWSSVCIGLIWACWHLPLFFIPDQLQHQLPFPLFLLNDIALSIFFTWVFNSTGGSVFSAIILHTSVNYWSGVIPILPQSSGSLRPFAIATLLLWIFAVLVVWRVGPHLTGWHK